MNVFSLSVPVGKVVCKKQMILLVAKWSDKMGKRYKKGNHKKKKSLSKHDAFFDREKTINTLLNNFVQHYYDLSYPPLDSEYSHMNKQRLILKKLFARQGEVVWNKSRRRRSVYYDQLSRFKFYYTKWKHLTYYIYLNQRYDLPIRYCHILSYFMHNKCSFNVIRYQF